MKRSVVIYCPDRHIVYDGRTPDEIGVGGGITARVRMARALARRGHEVHMVVNCPKAAEFDGVHYWPLDGRGPTEGDVLIANTSGGALDLSLAADLATGFGLRLAWIHGTSLPKGFDRLAWDWVYAVSNFISAHIQREWGVEAQRILVAYNAFEDADFVAAEGEGIVRDPHALIYAGHPSKGLQAAIDLLTVLRESDTRYTLRVFGGNRLWGQVEARLPEALGMEYGGLVGQRKLVRELLASGFSIHLQERQEPFGIQLLEAMRAGCIVIVSAVGAFPELVQHGGNGLLIEGPPNESGTIRLACDAILRLTGPATNLERMRRAAASVPWSSDLMAEVWEQHWDWAIGVAQIEPASRGTCNQCGSEALRLADGAHCIACSSYLPASPATAVGPPV